MALNFDTIPRQYNLALATGLIVAVADAVQALFDAYYPGDIAGLLTRGFYLTFIICWGTKVFIDDHHIFAKAKSHPTVDFLFLILSYSLLIIAAALSATGTLVHWFLMTHFGVLIAWVLVGFALCSPTAKEQRAKLRVWLAVDATCLAILAAMTVGGDPLTRAPLLGLIFVAMIVDIVLSGTLTRHTLTGEGGAPATPRQARTEARR